MHIVNINKLLVLLFFIVPMFGKIITTLLLVCQNMKLSSIPSHVFLFPFFLGFVLLFKFNSFESLNDILWVIKPFFLIFGYMLGLKFLELGMLTKDINVSKLPLFISLIILSICALQFFGIFDIWSGSGSFQGRSTGGFRGFGELALIVYFLAFIPYLLPVLLLICVFTSSKLIIVSVILGVLSNSKKYLIKGKKFILLPIFIFVILFLYFEISSFFNEGAIFQNFFWSVVNCGSDCTSYTTRIDSSIQFYNNFSNPLFLLIGSYGSETFIVHPEVGLFFYIKLYGLFFAIFVFIYLSVLLKNLKSWPVFMILPIIDVYSLSFLGFTIIGAVASITAAKKYNIGKKS